MFKQLPGQDEKEIKRDEEFQSIFNFVATVHEDDNCYDLLTFVMRQLCDNPAVVSICVIKTIHFQHLTTCLTKEKKAWGA